VVTERVVFANNPCGAADVTAGNAHGVIVAIFVMMHCHILAFT
jgi:hypothetical protein